MANLFRCGSNQNRNLGGQLLNTELVIVVSGSDLSPQIITKGYKKIQFRNYSASNKLTVKAQDNSTILLDSYASTEYCDSIDISGYDYINLYTASKGVTDHYYRFTE